MNFSIEDFFKELRAQRKTLGLSQREIAEVMQMPQSHYSRVESGAVNVRLLSFVEMARALEMDVVLIPRKLLPAIEAVLENPDKVRSSLQRPAYALNDVANDDDEDRTEERIW